MSKDEWRPFLTDEYGNLVPKPEGDDDSESTRLTGDPKFTTRVVDPELEKGVWRPSAQDIEDMRVSGIGGIDVETYRKILTMGDIETQDEYLSFDVSLKVKVRTDNNVRIALTCSDKGHNVLKVSDKFNPPVAIIGQPQTFREKLARYHNLDLDVNVGIVSYEKQPEAILDLPTVTDEDIKDAFKDFDERQTKENNDLVIDTFAKALDMFKDSPIMDEIEITSMSHYPPIIVDSYMFKHVKSIEERMATSSWVKKEWYIRPAQFVLTGIVFIPREIIGDGKII